MPRNKREDVSEYHAQQLQRVRDQRLNYLVMSNWELTEIPEEVFDLNDLKFIFLDGNHLRTLPERLWDLPNLKYIDVTNNPVESLPDRPGIFIDLPIFGRCRTQLKGENINLRIDINVWQERNAFWASYLRATKRIRVVNIQQRSNARGNAKIDSHVHQIISLLADSELDRLTLRHLEISSLPEDIRRLRGLKYLTLEELALKDLPDWIGQLDLEGLWVENNELSAIPDSFRSLRHLKSLVLSGNPIIKIPEFVFDLDALEYLDLDGCNLREIPPEILRLDKLKTIDCLANPIESPPPEVVEKGLDAIRDYWRQRADTGVDYLCEAKLIILGEAGAGKTSLAHKIENPNYKLDKDEKSTEGIDVIRYKFPTAIHTRDNGDEKVLERMFQVNIWDFGGQEIYHATHQFFLTRRSVYVLVCDDRKEDTDFSYWLQAVEMLSDGSPVLIVQNEKQDRTRDINLSNLRARFANLRGSLPTNLDTNRGLEDVIKLIRKELESLPHVGVGLPATWKRVREALEQDKRDFISLEEYLIICQERGFTRREDKLQLSGYLHDLGICLHFQDDPLLKNTVVLKPSWGTDAVYRVLDDPEIITARGLFTQSDLQRIWSEKRYAGMQDELLQLMMKFQLCYALDSNQAYIAPQLLSSEQPRYPWDQAGGLVVRYEYQFLPKGILTRFIVAMHRLIAGGRLVWKTGVVLERDGTRAEIIEEYSQRRIRVRVTGPDPHGLLAIVDEQLERLHASFPRLQYERYLPCPCKECREKAEPYGLALEKLIKMAKKSQKIQCHESGDMVDAAQLVREILPGALRLEEYAMESRSIGTTPQVVPAPAAPEVFVSYAWNTESGVIVDRVQQALEKDGIRLIRDREEVRYRDSIRDFMRRIGRGKCVVVVISDKYLKSENCMFEMVEIAKEPGLRERIFPVVLTDANIYKATGRVKYVRYWEDEIQELDEALKTVRGDNLTKLQEDLNIYSEIRRLFDGIADTLRDMNALTPDQHEGTGFEELIRRVRAQLGV